MELRVCPRIFRLARRFAAIDRVPANPCRRDALIRDLPANQVLTFKLRHLRERIRWNPRAKNRHVGRKPDVRQMIRRCRERRQGCALRVESRPHPDAHNTHIALHVHTVRTIVRT